MELLGFYRKENRIEKLRYLTIAIKLFLFTAIKAEISTIQQSIVDILTYKSIAEKKKEEKVNKRKKEEQCITRTSHCVRKESIPKQENKIPLSMTHLEHL